MIKMISWNVNGLRACVGKGFFDFLHAGGADVVCVQETKMQEGQSAFDFGEYRAYWNSALKKGYSGTLVLTKIPPVRVTFGMGLPEHDGEGRVIACEFEAFTLVNAYTPNAQRDLARLPYRMRWEDDFRAYLRALDDAKPVILCGDLNVAHREIDIRNARANRGSAGFTDQERAKMTELLDSGFIDTFRHLYPERRDAYTWWSYMGGARANNVGWRIDYFLLSEKLRDRLVGADIHAQVMGSDHCPVELTIEG
jgi:exodeoxyribonuclease-3